MAHCSKTSTKHKVDDETRCFSSNWAETYFFVEWIFVSSYIKSMRS